jgi:isocitrate dehydrogenase (NAD+)
MHPITLIPGDGIGPEVASNVVRIIEASGVDIQWETHYAGAQALEKFGETLPKDLLDSILRNKVALGPITTPVEKGFTSVNVGLRKTLTSMRTFGWFAHCQMFSAESGLDCCR